MLGRFLDSIVRFFHHLFNPHCEVCRHEKLEDYLCESCEVLKQQLDISNSEKRLLLKTITEMTVPRIETHEEIKEELKPIAGIKSWKTKRAMLEKEDRVRADTIRRTSENIPNSKEVSTGVPSKEVDELEKELGIHSDNPAYVEMVNG